MLEPLGLTVLAELGLLWDGLHHSPLVEENLTSNSQGHIFQIKTEIYHIKGGRDPIVPWKFYSISIVIYLLKNLKGTICSWAQFGFSFLWNPFLSQMHPN